MSVDKLLSMPREDFEALVLKKLEYLITEGLVLREGNKYRLKTQQELDDELNSVLTD